MENLAEAMSEIIFARYSRQEVREVAMELAEEYYRMVRDGVIARGMSEEALRESFGDYLTTNMR